MYDEPKTVTIDRMQLERLKASLETLSRENHHMADTLNRMSANEKLVRQRVRDSFIPQVMRSMEPTEVECRDEVTRGQNAIIDGRQKRDEALVALHQSLDPLLTQFKSFDERKQQWHATSTEY